MRIKILELKQEPGIDFSDIKNNQEAQRELLSRVEGLNREEQGKEMEQIFEELYQGFVHDAERINRRRHELRSKSPHLDTDPDYMDTREKELGSVDAYSRIATEETMRWLQKELDSRNTPE